MDDYKQAASDYMRPVDDENESGDVEEQEEVVPMEHSVEKKVHDYKMHEVEEAVPQKKDYYKK